MLDVTFTIVPVVIRTPWLCKGNQWYFGMKTHRGRGQQD
jgi:hypothetical protein